MKTQKNTGGYLQFTRKDRIAIMIITLVLLITFLLPPALEKRQASIPPITDTSWMAALHKLEKPAGFKKNINYKEEDEHPGAGDQVRDRTADSYNNGAGVELFAFDPNTLEEAGWKKLGVREKTIRTILKYLSKGGKFRKPEDLSRIYGLPPAQYERLRPYIIIKENATAFRPGQQADREPVKKPSGRPASIEINTADSALFEMLPGIGPTLAIRIIRFREKLGGFYSIEQVKETFGLADSVFQKIRSYLRNDGGELRKIDLNKAGMEELKAHPYVRYNVANIIVQYRNQHGPFDTVEDLKKIAVIDNALYEKLNPYFFVRK